MTQELKVVYGGYEVGGVQSNRVIISSPTIKIEYLDAFVEFEMLLFETSDLITEEQALIAAFSKPRQDLTVELSSTVRYDWKQSAGTGFNQNPTIEKLDDEVNSDKVLRFLVSIKLDLPADLPGQNGLVDATATLVREGGQGGLFTVEGTYTRTTTGSAGTNFDTYGESYATSLLPTGTWKKLSSRRETNDTDTRCDFILVYGEVIAEESITSFSDADLIDPYLHIERDLEGLRYRDSRVTLPAKVTAIFSSFIDKTRTTNLKSKWEQDILPYIIRKVKEYTSGRVVLIEEIPEFEPQQNRLAGTVIFLVYAGNILKYEEETEDDVDWGRLFHPLHVDFPSYDYEEEEVNKKWLRRVTVTIITTDVNPGREILFPKDEGTFKELRVFRQRERFTKGLKLAGVTPLYLTGQVFTRVFQKVNT